MKIFTHIKYSCGLPFIKKFEDEGVETITFIQEKEYKHLYDGMGFTKVEDLGKWRSMMTKDDVVFFDFTGSGDLGDSIRQQGIPVFGGQKISDRLEHDRFYGIDIMKKYGIDVPECKYFKSRAEGIAFVKEKKGSWVYKPRGEAMSAATYVADNEETMIDFIKKQKEQEYLLQKRVDGIEFPCALYFANGEPMSPSYFTLEVKRFMAGDIGDNTGAQGAVTWFSKDLDNLAVKMGISKLFPFFKSVKYTGTVDLNTILVEEKGKLKMYGLEFTPRIGYGCEFGLTEIINEPYSELIAYCAREQEGGYIPVDNKSYGFDVRVSIPPYPLEATPETEKAVDFLFRKSMGNEIKFNAGDYTVNLIDVMKKDGNLVTAGGDGIIMEVCGKTKDLKAEQEKVFAYIKDEVFLRGRMCRNDPFCKAIELIPEISDMGFETI